MRATRLVVFSVFTASACAPRGPEPVVDGVSPAIVCTQSASTATITGSGFGVLVTDLASGEAQVERPAVLLVRSGTPVGGDDGVEAEIELSYEAGNLRWVSETQLEIDITPELGAVDGAWDVVVELASGETGTLANGMILLAPPVIDHTDPLQVCADAGVTDVALVGTNFVVGSDGTLPALTAAEQPIETLGAEECQELAGGHGQLCERILTAVDGGAYVLGGVPLTLTNPGSNGCSTTTPGQVDVVPPPTVTSVSPGAVCNAGGETVVTIRGTRFLDGTEVLFGGTPALEVNVIDDTTLEATLAAGTPDGVVDVEVRVPSGCDASLAGAIEVLGSGSVYFVDPPVMPVGKPTLATAFTAALTDVPTSIYLVDDAGARTEAEFRWSAAYPGRVLFWIDTTLADGEYDIGIETADGCGSLLPDAFVLTSDYTVDIKEVTPRYAWTFDYTNVSVIGRDTPPTGFESFEETPRLYLTPSVGARNTAGPIQGVSFRDEHLLSAVIPYGLDAGWYDLIVLNPDGAMGWLEYAVEITSQPPPVIDSVSPPSLPNSEDVPVQILGSDFRSPKVELTCLESGTTTTTTLTVTAWEYSSITAIVPATSYLAAVCTFKVTNSDYSHTSYSALSIRNPSENLFPWVSGPDLNEARRATAAAVVRVSSVSRYVYAFGGDQGDLSTALQTSERAPVSPYGEIGTWEYTKDLREPRTKAASATIGKFVYLLGGYNGSRHTEMVWRANVLDPVQVPHFDDLQLKSATTGLEAGTWTYRVVAYFEVLDDINPDGMSLPGDPITVKLPESGAPFHVTIEWTAVDRAIGYRVFRTPTADGTVSTVEWVADVTGLSFTDTGYGTTPDKYELQDEGDIGNWKAVAYLNTPRHSACVAVAPDPNPDPEVMHIYVAGGIDQSGNYLDTVEYVPVSILSEHEQEVPSKAILLSDTLSEARAECVGFTVDSSLHSVVSPGETYVYFVGGKTADRAVGTVDAGLVAEGGDLDPWLEVDDMSPARAGFGGAAASDFLYAFGGHGGLPSNTGVSSELDPLLLPDMVNWNSLGKHMNEARYLPGFAQESAVMFMLGGTTDATDYSKSTEYTNF
jgi:hypothetical protein